MTTEFSPQMVDRFLDHHWHFHPVDATFMGDTSHDMRLPPVGAEALAQEIRDNRALFAIVAATVEPDDAGLRLDRRMLLAELEIQYAHALERPRFSNPAWVTGEAAFALISLLLPQSAPVREDAILTRMAALPDFLLAAGAHLALLSVPQGWRQRAIREAEAMAVFLREDLALHPDYNPAWAASAERAASAFAAFVLAIRDLPDADPACGETLLSQIISTQHGLDLTPQTALALAADAYDRLGNEMAEMARAIDPAKTPDEILAVLMAKGPVTIDEAFASYVYFDGEARLAAEGLVTVADDYALDYRWMAPCFRRISQSLYFLFYRSPPALNPQKGSVYWVTSPSSDTASFLAANNPATVKAIHAVHHGSLGHHTQNARARVAPSRLARVAGTDCALGLAFLGSGTLIEGWACYVEDLLMETDGFYTPAEILLLKQFERRNAASVLVDINLHLGRWSTDEACAFYTKAGFAPARVEGEVVRNSMLPGSRLMYWLGVEGIKTLRTRWKGDTRAFHDRLLSFGHMPLAWIAEELERAGEVVA